VQAEAVAMRRPDRRRTAGARARAGRDPPAPSSARCLRAQRELVSLARRLTASSTSAARARRRGCAPDRTAPGLRCCSPGPAPTAAAAAAAAAFPGSAGRRARRTCAGAAGGSKRSRPRARRQPQHAGAVDHQAAGFHRRQAVAASPGARAQRAPSQR
jgi:hypothetical protein